MKKIIKNIALFGILIALATSCDIERKPKDAIDVDDSIVTASDMRFWQNGFMARLRGQQGSLYTMVQDLQADQLTTTVTEGNHYSGSTSWERVNADDYDRRDVYISYYQAIVNLNTVLSTAETLEAEPGREAEFDILRGRMHFYRAYCYANLALRYGTPYKAATASTDLCVPLVLKYEPKGRPSRATNAEVYAQILDKDLAEAKKLLAKVKGTKMADEITLDAALALEARTRLYMGDWANAYKVATDLINSGTYPLVAPTEENFKNMWLSDNSTEEILQLFVSRPDETLTINTYFGAVTDALRPDDSKGVNNPSYIPTMKIINLYQDGDLRKNVYFEQQVCNFQDVFHNLYVVSKRKGNPVYAATQNKNFTFWGGYLPNGMHKPKVFRIAEQYLIAAEAAYQLKDETNARKYLNALRESRGLDMVDASGATLYKEIKDERTRELAFEGFRLWDLRRWGDPMERIDPQTDSEGDAATINAPGKYDVKYPATDYRFVWPIPANDINTNPNVAKQQNPGW